MRKRFVVSLALFLFGFGFLLGVGPRADAQGETLRIAIKPIEPFVIVNSSGEPSGFSIDLWNAIAQRAGVPFEYVAVATVADQLDAVQNDAADAAIAAISITRDREAVVDFSYPYYKSGLQIMTIGQAQTPFGALIPTLLSPRVLTILGAFLLTILVAAHLIWLTEHRRNPEFPHDYVHGVWEGIWWATVTVFTVGYGDKTPKGVLGRLLAMVWMLFSLFLIANFTASLTAALTINELRGEITGVDDLPGKSVASVEASTAARFLANIGVPPVVVPNVDEAVKLLQAGQVQAVVYDAPVLQYKLLNAGDEQLHLAGTVFSPEDYGIAFAQGSEYVEPIDQAILALVEDGTYEILRTKWFGVTGDR